MGILGFLESPLLGGFTSPVNVALGDTALVALAVLGQGGFSEAFPSQKIP